jgi:hypothetical protein
MTDTTRRKFFGLLAAAPVVVPTIAKEMAAEISAPRAAWRQIHSGESLWIDGARDLRPRYGNVINMSMAESEAFMEALNVPSVSFKELLIVPNRLFGAQINADGDAV